MRALIVALSLALVPAAASAQSWRPVARHCAQVINRRTKCGSCGGLWPYWAVCTAQAFYGRTVSDQRIGACVSKIYSARQAAHACNACGDPVADTMRCLKGY